MKKMILALAALAFMAWGSSSDDDDDNTPTPPEPDTPAILTPGTDERPTWPAINFDLYEQNMYVEIQLQDIFLDHASDANLLSAKIGDEKRGVAKPLAIDGTWVFPLFIAANESGGSITLSYYSIASGFTAFSTKPTGRISMPTRCLQAMTSYIDPYL